VAVIEAGLGGRFDATNVVPSKVQVITSVGLEHTRWLGPTLKDIAEEKLAVVRDHGTLVTGALDGESRAVARRVATARSATLVAVGPAEGDRFAPADLGLTLRAPGRFQRGNFAIAAAAAEAFLGRPLDPASLQAAARETTIPGRVEIVAHDPLTVYDGAHNPAGAHALAESLGDVLGDRRPRVAVIGVLEDKDAAAMLAELLPHFDHAVYTRSQNPRSLSPGTLVSLAEKLGGPPAETMADPHAALRRARALAGLGGAVVAAGSIYLIADLVRDRPGVRASRL
jgi:dihydrofolate synthase / folylpolyglutamate synthase